MVAVVRPFSLVSITNPSFSLWQTIEKNVFFIITIWIWQRKKRVKNDFISNLNIDLWDLRFQSSSLKSPKSIKYWWLIKELLKFLPKCNKHIASLFFLGFRRKEDIGLVWLLITLLWVIKKLSLMVNGLLRIINDQLVPRLALNIGHASS